MRKRRVAIAGLSQESNSFTGLDTTLAQFEGSSGYLYEGAEVIEQARGTNTVTGGFVAEMLGRGWDVVPVLDAHACPGGPLERETFENLRDRIVSRVSAIDDLDGVLLSLHGAMLAGGYPDPEGDLLGRLRDAIGDVPIVAVLDLHANVSKEMVRAATVLVAYKTYPHVDLAESGRKAASLLAQALEQGRAYHARHVSLPMLLPSINMRTIEGQGPMHELQLETKALAEANPSIAEIGLYGGFPFADVPINRAGILVYADSPDAADKAAVTVAASYWGRRERFLGRTPPAREAFAAALAEGRRPTIIADVADNPASGGAGDTTTLLKLLLADDTEGSFAGIYYDPATVARAFALGVGAEGTFEVGGKVNPDHGSPATLHARVLALSDGEYVCTGPMNRGARAGIGRAALLRAGNVEIGVAEGRASVNDSAMLETLGVDWRSKRVLALKVKGHFRAAFGQHVGAIVDAEAPGAAPTDLTSVSFTAVKRPVFPLDQIDWEPSRLAGGESDE